ncbi:hypothetical protein NL676_001359 [Syzygium grande]|nr:hypothetical protein NL676_001359 [Syzygium grande]
MFKVGPMGKRQAEGPRRASRASPCLAVDVSGARREGAGEDTVSCCFAAAAPPREGRPWDLGGSLGSASFVADDAAERVDASAVSSSVSSPIGSAVERPVSPTGPTDGGGGGEANLRRWSAAGSCRLGERSRGGGTAAAAAEAAGACLLWSLFPRRILSIRRSESNRCCY